MNNCFVKITLSMEHYYYTVEDVIYFRAGLSPDFISRWLWFFDYIAARVKVLFPRRRVNVSFGPSSLILGEEWRQIRRAALIKSRTSKLAKLVACPPQPDLFGFSSHDYLEKCNRLRGELSALENDTFLIPTFPVYINKIHYYLRPARV